jgi:hypothetical protein
MIFVLLWIVTIIISLFILRIGLKRVDPYDIDGDFVGGLIVLILIPVINIIGITVIDIAIIIADLELSAGETVFKLLRIKSKYLK